MDYLILPKARKGSIRINLGSHDQEFENLDTAPLHSTGSNEVKTDP